MSKDNGNGVYDFDFSNIYYTEDVEIFGRNEEVLFIVTVREIPHGEFSKAQDNLIKVIPNLELIGKKQRREASMNRGVNTALKNGQFSTSAYQDEKIILGIQTWTLKDKSGKEAPVTLEVYHLLPHVITEQIEKAVERLNPDMDEEFQSESGDPNTA